MSKVTERVMMDGPVSGDPRFSRRAQVTKLREPNKAVRFALELAAEVFNLTFNEEKVSNTALIEQARKFNSLGITTAEFRKRIDAEIARLEDE